jgi:hypothetical protein
MKFKNIKKKIYKKAKSPSNSRTIPAFSLKFSLPKFNSAELIKVYREVLKIFVVFVFILTAVIVGLDFHNNLQAKNKIDLQREVITKELNFWKDFIIKHKDYRDAYFQASILEYELGDISKARIHVEKGLSLDLNSKNGKKLEEFLR